MEGRRKKEIWEVGRLEVVYNNPTLLPRTRTGMTNLCGPYLQIKEVAANVPLLETKIRDNDFKLKPFNIRKLMKLDCSCSQCFILYFVSLSQDVTLWPRLGWNLLGRQLGLSCLGECPGL